jgi:hypothetical protein
MPQDMIDQFGFPPLTPEIKADVLGRNYARVHGIDLAAARKTLATDAVSRRRADRLDPPWSKLEDPAVVDPLALEVEARA